jgi:GTP pyrophosphokinase
VTTVLGDLDATLAEALGEQAERLDLELIDRAYRLSAAAHRGQKRVSGEDFISHTVAVARILLDHNMDSVTIAAALLHDTVEDSDVSIEDIGEQSGNEIGDIVDGLSTRCRPNGASGSRGRHASYMLRWRTVAARRACGRISRIWHSSSSNETTTRTSPRS